MKENNKKFSMLDNRPEFPKRAVVTGGMPYGNKELHLGHIGGVFIHADTYARFLRDRIGDENVVFVSGTDCYGSPIIEYYRKAKENGEDVPDTLEDFVLKNHHSQKEVLDLYNISLNKYATSAFGDDGSTHQEISTDLFMELYKKGALKKIKSEQFYDTELEKVLNGRQVVGKCPIPNCNAETAYSDECALGHQYRPKDLLNPLSQLSGSVPKMIEVENWYFDLESYMDVIDSYINTNKTIRKVVKSAIAEFLKEPITFVKADDIEKFNKISQQLPSFTMLEEQKQSSYAITFSSLEDRDRATIILGNNAIQFRNGKTLVPFRLTGNEEWGLKAPTLEGLEDLTFWVWPESLFAPISFTKSYLKSIGENDERYKDFWYSKDAQVYQFIGSDNIYFYGIAEIGMFLALQGDNITLVPTDGNLTAPNVIANNHVLFLDKKASSSGKIKAPSARELLEYYTVEQLKTHFLAFGLGSKSVGFKPKPLNPETKEDENDPVLVEGNLYTNVLNRLLRTFFYSIQEYSSGIISTNKVSDNIIDEANNAICKYERHMYKYEFHRVIDVLDSYIRNANKYFVREIKNEDNQDQVFVDTLHMIKVIANLIHPIMDSNADMILEYFNITYDGKFWSWDNIFKPIYQIAKIESGHKFKFLEPKVDFFTKLDSQYN
ncbi:MAG: class I tRNA ligase family protein [Lachnospirales bacterium]